MLNKIKKNALWFRIGAGVSLIVGIVLILISCLGKLEGLTFKASTTLDMKEVFNEQDEDVIKDSCEKIEYEIEYSFIFKDGKFSILEDSELIKESYGEEDSPSTAYFLDVNDYEYSIKDAEIEINNSNLKFKNGGIYTLIDLLDDENETMIGVRVGPVVVTYDLYTYMFSTLFGNPVKNIVVLVNPLYLTFFIVGIVLSIAALVTESFVCAAVYIKRKEKTNK